MYKKPLLIAGLSFAIVGGGIAFQSFHFPVTDAHASTKIAANHSHKGDGDGEMADDQKQVKQDKGDGDGEVADDQEQVKEDKGDGDGEVSDAKEQQQLKKAAKISKEAAVKTALASVKGQVKQVELENENGRVNFNVVIKNNNTVKEVKVDATNGSLLKIESGDKDNEKE
ncbi:putative membrane protein YkoI [Scopulibacillus darangshiensis]|uniref:Putative membrane protein YkoI n=1 Tax=Scopulibacillus darangshiensis TaxID=442528 RepID=A0A4R2NSC7_9BACL|nr:PepSY domain-containing protein [Scopulibacillus darangshiensis]TCP24843.1 putative membrane protein YkoI [Scopulibacillus darangshiensis]